jgi:metallo-beta-lactamase family protein
MCEAGRIRHHLKRRLWEEKSTVLLTGFQAPGTLGALLEGGKKEVKIHGEDVKVRAEIINFDAYSGHADADGLVDWVLERRPIRRSIFLCHGDQGAIEKLAQRLAANGVAPNSIVAPQLDETIMLERERIERKASATPRLAPEELGRPDWHNDLAQLLLDIRAALDEAADEKARAKILRRLRRGLEGEES